ncbi:MAG: phospholipase [Polyangiaceae bacterium]|nr:phospholipase [Polyangiaceae bacterium]
MKQRRFGDLDVWCAGGSDREGGGDGPAIVLCHGFGAPGDDLVDLWRAVDVGKGVRWFFPEAPLSLEEMFGAPARAWWLIDMARLDEAIRTGRRDELAESTPDGMAEARTALEGCLAALEKDAGVRRDKTVIGGFSQGAMITTEVSLFAEQPWAGLVILSGTLLCRDRWKEAATKTARSLHVAMTHGRRDPLLPFSLAEELRDILVGAGADVRFVAHNGGHEIPQSALEALAELAKKRLG